jgi:hypothetical protein
VLGRASAIRAGDDGVSRRLKALACTAPLHDLDARKTRLDWLDAAPYQMAEIGLQAIDQVTLAMDFDHGADRSLPTVQYAEALRQKLDATLRDVRSVDWLGSVRPCSTRP